MKNPRITLPGSFYGPIFTASKADILIDSSKMVDWTERRLKTRADWKGATPYFIFLYRDGRGVLCSNRRKFPDKSVRELAEDWKASVERIKSFYSQWPEETKISLVYRDLAINPEQSMRALCQWLGIEYQGSMLRYWDSEQRPIEGNKKTRSLVKRQQEQALARGDKQRPYQSGEAGQAYDGQVEPAIRHDERWRSELSAEALEIFEAIAGDTNRAMGAGE